MSHFTLVLMGYAAINVYTFRFIYTFFKVVFKKTGSQPIIKAALSSTNKYDVTFNNFEQAVVFNKITYTFCNQKFNLVLLLLFTLVKGLLNISKSFLEFLL